MRKPENVPLVSAWKELAIGSLAVRLWDKAPSTLQGFLTLPGPLWASGHMAFILRGAGAMSPVEGVLASVSLLFGIRSIAFGVQSAANQSDLNLKAKAMDAGIYQNLCLAASNCYLDKPFLSSVLPFVFYASTAHLLKKLVVNNNQKRPVVVAQTQPNL